MNWSKWARQIHRWLSILFTATVLVNLAVLGQDESTRLKVAYLPLFPLVLLLLTGLYLFVLPYLTRRRTGQRTD